MMTILIHPQFRSESEAYHASSDALSAAYAAPAVRTYRDAVERETAVQIARLCHYRGAREYLCEVGLEDGDE